MNVPYFPNIPNAPDDPADDQPLMQTNAGSIATLIGVDHVGFGNNDGGRHKQVQAIAQAVIPAGLRAGEGTLYTKTLSGNTQLYYTPDVSGKEFILTRTDTAFFASCGTGWSFLPGGGTNSPFIQYGIVTGLTTLPSTVTFTRPFQSPPISIVASALVNTTFSVGAANEVYILNGIGFITATGFQISASNTKVTSAYWIAIGI